KIAGSDLPDQIAFVSDMVRTYAAFTGIVSKPAIGSSQIQGADGIAAECTKTHAGDVQQRGTVGSAALRPAEQYPGFVFGNLAGLDGMENGQEARGSDILFSPERQGVVDLFCPPVNQVPGFSVERGFLKIAGNEVLPDLWSY